MYHTNMDNEQSLHYEEMTVERITNSNEAEIVRRVTTRPTETRQIETHQIQSQESYPILGAPEPITIMEKSAGSSNIITIHGYMHKQGEHKIKGPIHKSWKRRYFALENTTIYYFHSHIECRQYFTTRNADLVIGAINLRNALQLRPCARLDLPYKGFELITKSRVWVLCPETEDEYRNWFQGVEIAIVSSGVGNIIERKLPNVRKYRMKGIPTYRLLYFCFIIASIFEIIGLIFLLTVGIQPCDLSNRDVECDVVFKSTPNVLSCSNEPFNGYFKPPTWYLELAGVDDVICFHNPPIAQWLSFFALVIAEFLSFILCTFYYLGMWKPVRRGAHYFDEFEPQVPDELWPKVDILICHYGEPAEECIDTLMACMNLQYPPQLLQIYILDDGYCTTRWTKGNNVPHIELHKEISDKSGDLRQEVAQFMYDRVSDPNEDMEVYAWRKLHSSANLPTISRPKAVNRADCAVGSFRDDYRYAGLPHVTFIGRVKPPKDYAKAGNINNCLYNEGANGRYVVILDADMQPHPKFILATLPFFFDDEDRQYKNKFSCCCTGCVNVAKMCCANCKMAGVPEERISYCSKECFENAQHVASALHRRQVNGTLSADTSGVKRSLKCTSCGANLNKNAVCRTCSTVNDQAEQVDISVLHSYSDDVRDNAVAYVQTPQYFRECAQLKIGDPLGHRNSTFYDSIQTGQDGYDCATFVGTNALIRREALDSIGGIQYGTLTDMYTGHRLCSLGWKGLYFRKDFEGDKTERIRLVEGMIPDSVAGSFAQRRRWAKGSFQTALMKKNKGVPDPEWCAPLVSIPKYHKANNFMRRVFYINQTMYPLESLSVILFYYITLCFLYTGYAPILLGDYRVLIVLLPRIIIQGVLSSHCTRGIDSNDIRRSQESYFVYAFTNLAAIGGALWWKITGKKSRWVDKRHITRGSFAELPNTLVFFATACGIVWAIVRYGFAYNNRLESHGDSMLSAAVLLGLFIVYKLAPSVRMSVQEYFGWSYRSLMDQGNFMGSSSVAFGLMMVVLWVYIEKPLGHIE